MTAHSPSAPDLLRLLACPACGSAPLRSDREVLACTTCDWAGAVRDDILVSGTDPIPASFDSKHDMVDDHNHHPVVWELCYRRQVDLIEGLLRPGAVVLDLGCGPSAPYRRPQNGSAILGVEPSLPSLRSHPDLDLGLNMSAAALPLTDQSVDVVLAVYSLHHMIGDTLAATAANVAAAFSEMARVARPGADVVVLEICPWRWAWAGERAIWRAARRTAPSLVDFLFWPSDALARLGTELLPPGELDQRRYEVGRFDMFPPVIGIPRLKVPRALYPFDVVMLHWKLGPGERPPGRSAPSTERWWAQTGSRDRPAVTD